MNERLDSKTAGGPQERVRGKGRDDREEFTRDRQRLVEARADPRSPRSAALMGGSRWCNVSRQWNGKALRDRQLRQVSPEDSRTKSSAGQTHRAADSTSGPMRSRTRAPALSERCHNSSSPLGHPRASPPQDLPGSGHFIRWPAKGALRSSTCLPARGSRPRPREAAAALRPRPAPQTGRKRRVPCQGTAPIPRVPATPARRCARAAPSHLRAHVRHEGGLWRLGATTTADYPFPQHSAALGSSDAQELKRQLGLRLGQRRRSPALAAGAPPIPRAAAAAAPPASGSAADSPRPAQARAPRPPAGSAELEATPLPFAEGWSDR